MSYKAIKLIIKKHRVCRKCKDNKHPACIRTDTEAKKKIKRARYTFEKKLAMNIRRIQNHSENVTVSRKGMSEQFNKIFVSVFTKEDSGNIPSAEWMYKGSIEESLCNIEITEDKVVRELERLKDDKAAGADELAQRFLNSIKGGISYPLTLLFKKILQDEEVPDNWREANVVPFFKGGDRGTASNYRPISLTSQISKTFESMVRDEIVAFLERLEVIRNTEHGFRKGKSCLTNLFYVIGPSN